MALVLVVDDNLDTYKPLRRILQYMGHDVSHAANGVDALGQISARKPNLVLMDISMPDMDGLEVLRRMRSDPELAELPVVMYSALSDERRQKEARDLGAIDYLVKGSMGIGDLKSSINRHLH